MVKIYPFDYSTLGIDLTPKSSLKTSKDGTVYDSTTGEIIDLVKNAYDIARIFIA